MAFLLSLSRQTLRRRAGRLALLGWIGVCTLGAVALAAENALEFGGQASLCVLLLLATLNRTVAGWAPRERRTGARRFACCGRQGRVDGVDVVDVSEIPTDVAPACGTC